MGEKGLQFIFLNISCNCFCSWLLNLIDGSISHFWSISVCFSLLILSLALTPVLKHREEDDISCWCMLTCESAACACAQRFDSPFTELTQSFCIHGEKKESINCYCSDFTHIFQLVNAMEQTKWWIVLIVFCGTPVILCQLSTDLGIGVWDLKSLAAVVQDFTHSVLFLNFSQRVLLLKKSIETVRQV